MLSYVLPEQPGRQLDRLIKVLRMGIDDLRVDSRHDVPTPRYTMRSTPADMAASAKMAAASRSRCSKDAPVPSEWMR